MEHDRLQNRVVAATPFRKVSSLVTTFIFCRPTSLNLSQGCAYTCDPRKPLLAGECANDPQADGQKIVSPLLIATEFAKTKEKSLLFIQTA
jgi:hypothetical protein